MTCLTVKWAVMDAGARAMGIIPDRMDQIVSTIDSIGSALSFSNTSAYEIRQRLRNISGTLSDQSAAVRRMENALVFAKERYISCENQIAAENGQKSSGGAAFAPGGGSPQPGTEGAGQKGGTDLKDLLTGILGEMGAAGKLDALLASLTDSEKSAMEKALATGEGAAGIIGVLGSWMSSGMDTNELQDFLLGLDIKHFPEGLDFFDALKNEAGEYLFENGDDMTNAARAGSKLSVGAKWAGGLLSFIGNGYDNYNEYREGDISGGRAIAETVTETAVDVGVDMALSAGVAAGAVALGVTSAPALAVGGVAVVAKWGLDCLSESVFGKDLTELVSDGLLDAGEALASGASKLCKDVADLAGNAVSAAADGVRSLWKSVVG